MSVEPEVPANTEGVNATMDTTDEIEDLENAGTFVRSAFLGKGDRRV